MVSGEKGESREMNQNKDLGLTQREEKFEAMRCLRRA